MQRYQPMVVYHAAAYKHVPLMERHVIAAVENNIFGTWQVARAAAENGVQDFVLISTEKAVRPTSMTGATKRFAELVSRTLEAGTVVGLVSRSSGDDARMRSLIWGVQMRLRDLAGVRLGRTAVALALFGVLAIRNGWAQEIVHATGPLPSFELATVKMEIPDSGVSAALIAEGAATGGLGAASGGGPNTTAGGEKITRQTTLSVFFGDAPLSHRVQMTWKGKSLIAKAYGLLSLSAESRVVGGPKWIESEADRYAVEAKIDDAEFTELQKMPPAEQTRQVELMEQALLIDRFKLKVHFETRDVLVYTLVVAKGGSKMTAAKAGGVSQLTGVGDGQNNTLTAQAMTMDQFVHSPLLRPEGRIVIDRTGLTGAYDFTLKSSSEADPGADGPSLFTGIEEQLGLKLVATKAPMEVIVVDHIERPGEN